MRATTHCVYHSLSRWMARRSSVNAVPPAMNRPARARVMSAVPEDDGGPEETGKSACCIPAVRSNAFGHSQPKQQADYVHTSVDCKCTAGMVRVDSSQANGERNQACNANHCPQGGSPEA